MTHSITLQINPDSLKFLNQYKKRHLSYAQRTFMESVKNTDKELSELKKQSLFEFTPENEAEVRRGNFYAITKTLQENFDQEKISLESLQAALENDLNIKDKEMLSFITLCLVEPVWLPGALSTIACSLFTAVPSYTCSNQKLSGSLEANIEGKCIRFQLNLCINVISAEGPLHRGTAAIYFTFDNDSSKQVKLLPIDMQFDFPDEEESKTFQLELIKNFKMWLLHEDELTKINAKLYQMMLIKLDRYVIPILFGLFISSIAMVSFTVLSLNVISVFLLPPLGLALGLILTSLINSGVYLIRKKEEKKLQRPIYLFKKKQFTPKEAQTVQTTSLPENTVIPSF